MTPRRTSKSEFRRRVSVQEDEREVGGVRNLRVRGGGCRADREVRRGLVRDLSTWDDLRLVTGSFRSRGASLCLPDSLRPSFGKVGG